MFQGIQLSNLKLRQCLMCSELCVWYFGSHKHACPQAIRHTRFPNLKFIYTHPRSLVVFPPFTTCLQTVSCRFGLFYQHLKIITSASNGRLYKIEEAKFWSRLSAILSLFPHAHLFFPLCPFRLCVKPKNDYREAKLHMFSAFWDAAWIITTIIVIMSSGGVAQGCWGLIGYSAARG